MARPNAYDPQEGYCYQILCRSESREWEHCDYATDRTDKKHLLTEYALAYGAGWEFKSILLPRKFWPKQVASPLPAVPATDPAAPAKGPPILA